MPVSLLNQRETQYLFPFYDGETQTPILFFLLFFIATSVV
jgi:hypothetical protein